MLLREVGTIVRGMTGTRPWAGKSPPGGAQTGGNHFGGFNCAGGRGAGLQGAVPCLASPLPCLAVLRSCSCPSAVPCTAVPGHGEGIGEAIGKMTRLGGGGHESCTTYRCTRGEKGGRPKTEHATFAVTECECCTTYHRTKGGKGVWAGDYGVGLMG